MCVCRSTVDFHLDSVLIIHRQCANHTLVIQRVTFSFFVSHTTFHLNLTSLNLFSMLVGKYIVLFFSGFLLQAINKANNIFVQLQLDIFKVIL